MLLNFEELVKRASQSHMLCHGCDLLNLFFGNLEIGSKGNALMQHISWMGSDCLIFIDFTKQLKRLRESFVEFFPSLQHFVLQCLAGKTHQRANFSNFPELSFRL
jgi:hypothetical protein